MREDYDYIAKTVLYNPGTGQRAYNPGDGMHASVVENLGYQIGTDVVAARADMIPRPAGNAKRAEWERYWLAQGFGQDDVDAMTRDEMAHREPPAEGSFAVPPADLTAQVAASNPQTDAVAAQANPRNTAELEAPGSDGRKADWVTYAISRGMDEKTANDSTIAQLQEFDYDHLS